MKKDVITQKCMSISSLARDMGKTGGGTPPHFNSEINLDSNIVEPGDDLTSLSSRVSRLEIRDENAEQRTGGESEMKEVNVMLGQLVAVGLSLVEKKEEDEKRVSDEATVKDNAKVTKDEGVKECVTNDMVVVVKSVDKVVVKVKACDQVGALCPRSPMRPDHSLARNIPYKTSRNQHLGAGGYVVRAAESESYRSYNATFLEEFNVLPLNIVEDLPYNNASFDNASYDNEAYDNASYDNASYDNAAYDNAAYDTAAYNNAYADLLSLSPDFVDEGLGIELDPSPSLVQEQTADELVAILSNNHDLARILDDIVQGNELQSGQDDCPDDDDVFTNIPSTVVEINAMSTPDARWQREESIPSVGENSTSNSSGYNSSCSPRSGGTPSPAASFKGSQEQFSDFETHGVENIRLNPDFPTALSSSLPTTYHNHAFSNAGGAQRDVDFSQDFQDVFDITGSYESFDASSKTLTNVDAWTANVVTPVNTTNGTNKKDHRLILPKPNIVEESAKARLLTLLNPESKRIIWANISTKLDEVLTRKDGDGDTQLMILLLAERRCHPTKLEYVYALVERLKQIPGALTSTNNMQQSVLYLAALYCADEERGLITRYIAETLVELKVNVDEIYEGGNTLLHLLCSAGDQYCDVIAELLSVKDLLGRNCFNVNKYNNKGLTALLVAVRCHTSCHTGAYVSQTSASGAQICCTKIVRLLISAGADASLPVQDTTRSTALQLAIATSCDPSLVEALLTSPYLRGTCAQSSYRADTVLHQAARRAEVSAAQRERVCAMLVASGARKDARDREGRYANELMSTDRR